MLEALGLGINEESVCIVGRRVVRVTEEDKTQQARRADQIPLIGNVYSKVLKEQKLVQAPDGGTTRRILAPVTNRGDTIGILELFLPEVSPDALEQVEEAAHALAYIVVTDRRFTKSRGAGWISNPSGGHGALASTGSRARADAFESPAGCFLRTFRRTVPELVLIRLRACPSLRPFHALAAEAFAFPIDPELSAERASAPEGALCGMAVERAFARRVAPGCLTAVCSSEEMAGTEVINEAGGPCAGPPAGAGMRSWCRRPAGWGCTSPNGSARRGRPYRVRRWRRTARARSSAQRRPGSHPLSSR